MGRASVVLGFRVWSCEFFGRPFRVSVQPPKKEAHSENSARERSSF